MSKKNINNIPDEVLWLALCGMTAHPVGSTFYEKTVRSNPEYFPKEAEYFNKWDKIPQEVHDAYLKEIGEEFSRFMNSLPQEGRGIWESMNHTEASVNYQKEWDRLFPEHDKRKKEIHKKYYSKYKI